jgi:putative NADH-flavin reductase
MKIVLFGATGNVGQRVATEALNRGHEVIGVVRDPSKSKPTDARAKLVAGDATDQASVAAAVRGADAIVNSISPRPNAYGKGAPSLTVAARSLLAAAQQANIKRLIIVGGAGSLEVAPGVALVDTPQFPEAYKAEAVAQRDALTLYRAEAGDFDWTYISPALIIQPGERTGSYRTTGDQLLSGANGAPSSISFEDYAVAVVDELEKPKNLRKRIGVAN